MIFGLLLFIFCPNQCYLLVQLWPSWAAEFLVLKHTVEMFASALLQYQAYRTVNCIRNTLYCNGIIHCTDSIIHCTDSVIHCTVIMSCILYCYIIRNTLYCYCIRYITVSESDIQAHCAVSSSSKCLCWFIFIDELVHFSTSQEMVK